MKATNKIEQTDLSKPIYDKVKAMILAQELKPGQKIIQEKLSADLGVSRTPLAKALQMLEFEMLVESKPRRGMYVKSIDLIEMHEIFEVREVLEAMAVRKITEKKDERVVRKLESLMQPFIDNSKDISRKKYAIADEKFHQVIVEESGNSVLGRMYVFGSIHEKIVQMGLVRPPEDTLKEHKSIIDAIKSGDAELAATQAALHIRKSSDLIRKEIDKNNQ